MAYDPRMLQILELLRQHMKQSKFVGKAYGSELSTIEGFIIVELDVDSTRSFSELARLLGIDKSGISRAVQNLAAGRYLAVERAAGDSRRKRIRILPRGTKFLRLHDDFNGAKLAELTARLSVAELSELQLFFKTMADGLGASSVRLRPKESPLLVEMRRISRGFSIFGGSLSGSGHSSLEWQILSEIREAPAPLQAGHLCEAFAISLNTMSRILARLETRGLITRAAIPEDRRCLRLSLTAAGQRTLAHIVDCTARLLTQALQSSPPAQLDRWIELFSKYLGLDLNGRITLLPSIHMERLESAADRTAARGFLIWQLVRLNAFLDVPEVLIGAQHYCFALKTGGELAGVLEVGQTKDGLRLLNFATAPQFDHADVTGLFVQRVFHQLSILHRLPIEVPAASLTRRWLDERSELRIKDQSGVMWVEAAGA